jgi:hypothetical protein
MHEFCEIVTLEDPSRIIIYANGNISQSWEVSNFQQTFFLFNKYSIVGVQTQVVLCGNSQATYTDRVHIRCMPKECLLWLVVT